jgi:hypothetical protein
VEEVKAWAEHSQQLPLSVVTQFYNNRITGYDFPELLADDGALLESELGIQRKSLKRRIMRGMKMKLLGVGRSPEPPNPIVATPTTSSKISISWGHGRNVERNNDFPVHKYIIQRLDHDHDRDPAHSWSWNGYAYGLSLFTVNDIQHMLKWSPFRNQSIKDDVNDSTESHAISRNLELKLPWITVYEGMDTVFQDSGLAYSTEYEYRIVSWNAVGHSDMIYFSCKTLSAPEIQKTNIISILFLILKSAFGFSQLVLSVVAVYAMYLKYTRVNIRDAPLFQQAWKVS